MIRITVENLPAVRDDYTEAFREIADYQVGSVIETLAEGGKPPWERTKRGAIARLYDRFAHTIKGESDATSATISGGGSPDTFAHQYGADFMQMVTEKQKKFFWMQFYETGDEIYKWMALSKTLHNRIPQRSFMEFQDEDIEFIQNTIADNLLIYNALDTHAA